MDIPYTIERHRRPLLRIVATLFAMIGLVEGSHVERLSSPVYRAVLRLLRPAESAVRRLVVVAARGITLQPPRLRATPRIIAIALKGKGRVTFKLFDPRQRFPSAFGNSHRRRINLVRRPEPRLRVIDTSFDPRIPMLRTRAPAEQPSHSFPDGTVSAARLTRRLTAIKSALEDLPRQARRYLRWQARPATERRPSFTSALRSGDPPGFRKKPTHKVDEILAACDWLARHEPLSDSS